MNSEKAKRLKELQNLSAYLEESAKSFDCFLSDCNHNSIDSHSLSKSRVLSLLIQSKSEQLLMLDDKISADFKKEKISTFQARNRELIAVSALAASTFRGFCHNCDNSLFEVLDNNPYMNDGKTNFLHALRAYSHKLRNERKLFHFLRNDVLEMVDVLDDEIDKLYEKEAPFLKMLNQLPGDTPITWEQASPIFSELDMKVDALDVSSTKVSNNKEYKEIRSLLPSSPEQFPIRLSEFKDILISLLAYKNSKLGELQNLNSNGGTSNILKEYAEEVLKHQNDVADELTKCIRSKSYDSFESIAQYIPKAYSIAGNFVFYTEQNEEITLTFFPEKEPDRTVFIFNVWNPNSNQKMYLKKINILDSKGLTQFVSNVILSQGTNIYMAKEFVESLDIKEKELLCQVKTLKAFYSFNLFK